MSGSCVDELPAENTMTVGRALRLLQVVSNWFPLLLKLVLKGQFQTNLHRIND